MRSRRVTTLHNHFLRLPGSLGTAMASFVLFQMGRRRAGPRFFCERQCGVGDAATILAAAESAIHAPT